MGILRTQLSSEVEEHPWTDKFRGEDRFAYLDEPRNVAIAGEMDHAGQVVLRSGMPRQLRKAKQDGRDVSQ